MTLEQLAQRLDALQAQVTLLRTTSASVATQGTDGVLGRSFLDGFVKERDFPGEGDTSTWAFKVSGTGGTTVTVAAGSVQYGANTEQAIAEATFEDVIVDSRVYISLDLNTGVWGAMTCTAGASDPVDTGSTQYYMIANITVVDEVITEIKHRWLGDIYESKV